MSSANKIRKNIVKELNSRLKRFRIGKGAKLDNETLTTIRQITREVMFKHYEQTNTSNISVKVVRISDDGFVDIEVKEKKVSNIQNEKNPANEEMNVKEN